MKEIQRKTRGWRQELFDGLPTEMERRTDLAIDEAVAKRILAIEGMTTTPEETAKFVQVVSVARPRGLLCVTWKGIPIVDIIKKGKYPRCQIAIMERNIETGELGVKTL